MKNVVFLLVLIGIINVSLSMRYPRDPDQIQWANRTCFHENRQGSDVFCFAKCYWLYMGLFDTKQSIINVNAVKIQFQKRNLQVPNDIHFISKSSENFCDKLHKMTADFMENNWDQFQRAFYAHKEDVDAWYQENKGEVKAMDQTASDFCKNKEGDCRIDCQYYYYRLVTEDQQIWFKRVLKVPGISAQQLHECRWKAYKEAKGCAVAATLKNCLEGVNKNAWNAAEEYLDKAYSTCHYEKDLAETRNDTKFCFDKCYWTYLGFYEPRHEAINVNSLKAHFSGLKIPVPGDIASMGGNTQGNVMKYPRKLNNSSLGTWKPCKKLCITMTMIQQSGTVKM
ncbi:hypothetical protein DMENIID0001_148300 [Sergentomyia squamirostris]